MRVDESGKAVPKRKEEIGKILPSVNGIVPFGKMLLHDFFQLEMPVKGNHVVEVDIAEKA